MHAATVDCGRIDVLLTIKEKRMYNVLHQTIFQKSA